MESASLHQNVFLLMQAVPPSKDFLKCYKEGMFDKPNTIGFVLVSHYLLTIYSAERFKKFVEWPLHCKKDEAKYRNDVKELLVIIARENPDVDFPQILASHLLHAGGNKFTTIMWKLSTVALRTYIKRETGDDCLATPKSGDTEELTKILLNNIITQSCRVRKEVHKQITEAEDEAEKYANETIDLIQTNCEALYSLRHSLVNHASEAPVQPAIEKRLADPNDVEVIKMWKISLSESLNYLKNMQKKLTEITELSNNVAAMVTSIVSADSNTLDGNRLPKIDVITMTEVDELSPETQIALHRVYEDGVLVLENLCVLIKYILLDIRRYLLKHGFPDLSGCDLQVQASNDDMKSMIDLFHSLYDKITPLSEEIKIGFSRNSRKNVINDTSVHYLNEGLFDSVLLKESPTIKINCNNDSERLDRIDERLDLTPVEGVHKSLFSRHRRNEETVTQSSKFRPKILVSRINFDDIRTSYANETLSPGDRSNMSKFLNQSIASRTGKYSRLFSTSHRKDFNKMNSTALSTVGSSKDNTICSVSTICSGYNVSQIQHYLAPKCMLNESRNKYTPPKLKSTKLMANRASSTINDEDTSMSTSSIRQATIDKKMNLVFTPTERHTPKINKSKPNQQQQQQKQQLEVPKDRNRRCSISDLVERYKKLCQKGIDASHLENSSDPSDESAKD